MAIGRLRGKKTVKYEDEEEEEYEEEEIEAGEAIDNEKSRSSFLRRKSNPTPPVIETKPVTVVFDKNIFIGAKCRHCKLQLTFEHLDQSRSSEDYAIYVCKNDGNISIRSHNFK